VRGASGRRHARIRGGPRLTPSRLALQEDSCFISSPATGPKVFEILQQLMEDLNTYAEASIPIDQSSSIEIKLFPNLPKSVWGSSNGSFPAPKLISFSLRPARSPTKVENWHVPIPLIDLKPQLNWDLSMAKARRQPYRQRPHSARMLTRPRFGPPLCRSSASSTGRRTSSTSPNGPTSPSTLHEPASNICCESAGPWIARCFGADSVAAAQVL
jgi:hypothetical protein